MQSNDHGFDANESNKKPLNHLKRDSDRCRVDLLPIFPLVTIANVLGFGAEKYVANSWRNPDMKPVPMMRTYGSIIRHLFSWARGEKYDPESGLTHLGHAATQLFFLMEHDEKGEAEDDRFKDEDFKI